MKMICILILAREDMEKNRKQKAGSHKCRVRAPVFTGKCSSHIVKSLNYNAGTRGMNSLSSFKIKFETI